MLTNCRLYLLNKSSAIVYGQVIPVVLIVEKLQKWIVANRQNQDIYLTFDSSNKRRL